MKKSTLFAKLFSSLMAVLVAFFPVMPVCADLPQGADVVAGQVAINFVDANNLNITASDRSIINWNSYNIGLAQTVNYDQPSSSAISLNRVTGITSSMLEGTLRANGQVWLINPNGITMTRDFRADVAGLLASSLNIKNDDFLAKKYNLKCDGLCGKILNQADLHTNGYVALLGPQVINDGSITAPLNSIVLAAGEVMAVGLDVNNRISIAVNGTTKQKLVAGAAIQNNGTLSASGGHININASVLNTVFDQAINNTGIIEADSLPNQAGLVSLVTNNGSIEQNGNISAQNGQVIIQAVGINGKINDDGYIPNKISTQDLILYASEAIGQSERIDISVNNLSAYITGSGDVRINNVKDATHTGDLNVTQIIGNVNNLEILSDGNINANTLTANDRLDLYSSEGEINANKVSSGGYVDISAEQGINVKDVSAKMRISEGTSNGNIKVGTIITTDSTAVTLLGAYNGSIIGDGSGTNLITTHIFSAQASNQVGTAQEALKTKADIIDTRGDNGGVNIVNNSSNLQIDRALSVHNDIKITNTGAIDASNVISVEKDVNLVAGNGDIKLTDITAGRTAQIQAINGNILNGSGGGTQVTANAITLRTNNGSIGTGVTSANTINVNTNDIVAVTSVGNINVINSAAGASYMKALANSGDINLQAKGDVKVDALASKSNQVTVQSTAGSIYNNNISEITAGSLHLIAAKDIGSNTAHLGTAVDNITANSGSNTYIHQNGDARVFADSGKDLDVHSATGNLDIAHASSTTGNVSINAKSINAQDIAAKIVNLTATNGEVKLTLVNAGPDGSANISSTNGNIVNNNPNLNQIFAKNANLTATNGSIGTGFDASKAINVSAANVVAKALNQGDVNVINNNTQTSVMAGKADQGNINFQARNDVLVEAVASNKVTVNSLNGSIANNTAPVIDSVIKAGSLELSAGKDIGTITSNLNTSANQIKATALDSIHINQTGNTTVNAIANNDLDVHNSSGDLNITYAESKNANALIYTFDGNVQIGYVLAKNNVEILTGEGNIINDLGSSNLIDAANIDLYSRDGSIGSGSDNAQAIKVSTNNLFAVSLGKADVNIVNTKAGTTKMVVQAEDGDIRLQSQDDVEIWANASANNKITINAVNGSIINNVNPDIKGVSSTINGKFNPAIALTAGTLNLNASNTIGNSDPLIGTGGTLSPNALKTEANIIIAHANGIDAQGASVTINNSKGVDLVSVTGTNRVNIVTHGDTIAQNVHASNQGVALNVYDGNLTAGNIKADNQVVIINVNASATGQGGKILDDGNDATAITSGTQTILNTDKGIGIADTPTTDTKYVNVDAPTVSAIVRQQGDVNLYNKQGMRIDTSATGNIKGNVNNIDIIADGAINALEVTAPGNIYLESANNNVTVGSITSGSGIIAIGADGSIKDDNNEANSLKANHILLGAKGNIGDPGQVLGDIDIKTPDLGAISTEGSIYLNALDSPIALGLSAKNDINVITAGSLNILGVTSFNGNINIQALSGNITGQDLVRSNNGSIQILSNTNILNGETIIIGGNETTLINEKTGGLESTPTSTTTIITQSLNPREPVVTVDRLNQGQANRGPAFSQSAIAPALFYHPISTIDTSAVVKKGDELELEQGAFDFIDDNLKKRKAKQDQ